MFEVRWNNLDWDHVEIMQIALKLEDKEVKELVEKIKMLFIK